jgi:hypothetical protein
LAIAAESMAACSGVSCTSRWPIELCASAASSSMSPSVLPLTGSGTSKPSSSMPKASAMSRSRSSPSFTPSSAKAVLQEMVSASISDWSAPPLQLSPL